MRCTRWLASIAVVAVMLASCGGTHAVPSAGQRRQRADRSVPTSSANHPLPAQIVPAQPVALTRTPPALLAVCLRNSLLHAICPRLAPLADEPHTSIEPLGLCIDRAGRDLVMNGHYARLGSSQCVDAGWGYEAFGWPPGFTRGHAVSINGWDPATRTLAPGEALLIPPPVHVHIEIEASLEGLIGANSWPPGRHHVSDALLSPRRTQPVSLGWVRWYGRYGQLVLEPVYPFGGEWGGHLVFHFRAGRVSYAITLHAWMPTIRVTEAGTTKVTRFQAGPALPHVIATLKAMVGSALRG